MVHSQPAKFWLVCAGNVSTLGSFESPANQIRKPWNVVWSDLASRCESPRLATGYEPSGFVPCQPGLAGCTCCAGRGMNGMEILIQIVIQILSLLSREALLGKKNLPRNSTTTHCSWSSDLCFSTATVSFHLMIWKNQSQANNQFCRNTRETKHSTFCAGRPHYSIECHNKLNHTVVFVDLRFIC